MTRLAIGSAQKVPIVGMNPPWLVASEYQQKSN